MLPASSPHLSLFSRDNYSHHPPFPHAVLLSVLIVGTTIAPPIPNPPSCGKPPRTVPPACTEPRRSPLLEHPCPNSSRLLCGLLILSWTLLPRSPLRPLHNPPPSPHPLDLQSAGAEPGVRPSPFPPQETVPELQSPFWASPLRVLDNLRQLVLSDFRRFVQDESHTRR